MNTHNGMGSRGGGWLVTGLVALLGVSGCSRNAGSIVNRPAEAPLSELKLIDHHLVRIGQTNRFTGVIVETYPGGELKSRSVISNGLMWGVSEGWHTNGQRQVEEHFRAGVSDGLRTKWETNGVRLSEAMIVGGQLNGPFRRWHANGALAEEVSLKDGIPEGMVRAWYPSGCLKTEMRMAAGKTLEQRNWADGAFAEAATASGPTGVVAPGEPGAER